MSPTVLSFSGAGSVSGTSDHQILADFSRIFDGLRVATEHLEASEVSEPHRTEIMVAMARASLVVLEANLLFVAQIGEHPAE